MTHLAGLNGIHLICSKDLDCNTKILNSYCDRNSSCACERGFRYYTKFNKCVFSNHFHCETAQQCANLDPRLTCIDNYCTCKEREKRTDNYLCSAFRKYCYKGYRYNVETTDCVFVGDLTINQLENLDQSVEIFVIVLFFITSALFIASCINNYQNERREKLRRRIAQQQTMSLFAEQRRRMDLSTPIAEVIAFPNDDLFRNHNNQMRNGFSGGRHNNTTRNQNRHYRYQQGVMEYMKPPAFEDLPPSYEECMKKEESKLQYSLPLLLNPSHNLQINFAIIEHSNSQSNANDAHNSSSDSGANNIDANQLTANNQSDRSCVSCPPEECDNSDNQTSNQTNNQMDNQTNENSTMSHDLGNKTSNSTNNTGDHNACHINENDFNNNMPPVNIK